MRLTTKHLALAALTCSFLLLLLNACKHKPFAAPDTDGNYPAAVSKIIMNKCATAGCHNAASYQGAGNIRMDTWDQLFNGGGHGAVVIPYDIENSSLLYFINPDTAHGHTQEPRMPLNAPPLTVEEYLTIRDWIANGAPDKHGNIPFGSNPDTRQKIYVTMQGCDLLGVVDAERNVLMRYIRLGKISTPELPHNVKVSPDGRYAYVCFYNGNHIQKIDTRIDQVVGEADITELGASWNVLHVSPDGTQLVVSDLFLGMLKVVNTATMKVTKVITTSQFKSLHGIASNAAFDTFLVTSQYGNVVYKIPASGLGYRKISIDGAPVNHTLGARDPHEILMTPDYSKYFLTCQASNEVRVMDARADTLWDPLESTCRHASLSIL